MPKTYAVQAVRDIAYGPWASIMQIPIFQVNTENMGEALRKSLHALEDAESMFGADDLQVALWRMAHAASLIAFQACVSMEASGNLVHLFASEQDRITDVETKKHFATIMAHLCAFYDHVTNSEPTI